MTENHQLVPQAPPSRRKSVLLMLLAAAVLGIPAGFLFAHAVRMPQVKKLEDYQPAHHHPHLRPQRGAVRRVLDPEADRRPEEGHVAAARPGHHRHRGLRVLPPRRRRSEGASSAPRSRTSSRGRRSQGASTLTQQLAKQVFLTPEKTFRRKINEAFLAVQIEKDFTKDQIFELYANQVYLGHGAYGVEAASRLYFGKHAKDLTLPEAAMIAGARSARRCITARITHPDRAKMRRDYVLCRMLEGALHHAASSTSRPSTRRIVLGTYKEEAPQVGAYFSEEIRQYIENDADEVRRREPLPAAA